MLLVHKALTNASVYLAYLIVNTKLNINIFLFNFEGLMHIPGIYIIKSLKRLPKLPRE